MKLTTCRYPSQNFLLLTAFLFFCNCFKIYLCNITTATTTLTTYNNPSETLTTNHNITNKLKSILKLRNGSTFKSINNNSKNKKDNKRIGNRIAILITDKTYNLTTIQNGFKEFIEFFEIQFNIEENRVDFLFDEGLSGLIRYLENVNYTTVIKALNNDNNYNIVENDLRYYSELKKMNSTTNTTKNLSNTLSYCQLGEGLSKDYNKTILFWPCSNIKVSNNFLPSFEAISFAVRSIAKKLNWTEALILVADSNWGLPLTIAANLEIPYRIKIGSNNLEDLNVNDKIGKVFIIISSLKDPQLFNIIRKLNNLIYTKILLIDTESISFNINTKFYKNLIKLHNKSNILTNLIILTILSDKYRYFLNNGHDDNEMKFVKNYRKNLFDLNGDPINNIINFNTTIININNIKLNNNITNMCEFFDNYQHKLQQLNQNELIQICDMNLTIENIRKFQCWSTMNITKKILDNVENLQNDLKKLCKKSKTYKNLTENNDMKFNQINILKNLIDYFNFYDFLATYLVGEKFDYIDKLNNSNIYGNKFDFIVLDIIRKLNTSVNDNNLSSNISNDNWYKDSNESNYVDALIWRPFLILEQNLINESYTSHPVHPGYWDWESVLEAHILLQCGVICWILICASILLLLIIFAASVAVGIRVRNYLLRKRLSSGPNKIVLSVNDFVFPVDNRRVDEGIEAMLCCWLQQLQEFGGPEVDKPDLLKGSIGSLKNIGLTNNTTTGNANNSSSGVVGGGGGTNCTIRNTTNSGSGSLVRNHTSSFLDMRARYNGDLVQLKEVPIKDSIELKSKAMDLLVVAHGLRHENLNPLLGWLSDPSRTALVFDYCSRGSLQDVLIMDEIKLDWSFRLSLLTDLVRGMRYLHSSPLRVHGSLTSRNCVVDARWVLKITDYCLPAFYEAQCILPREKNLKELFWTAPELLRNTKGHNKCGTQMGDVYSFGIIMQEVVLRGEPYCMLSLTVDEIISKIKKPPPLIRPSVSKGAAPPEAINIMRQCWAEQPDMRPDFNSVYERFKMLNHGRKVNFVDTMFQMLEKYSNNLEELIRERTEQLDIERKKTEQLLNRMLPSSVAEKLKMGLGVDPEEFSDVTIYFSDIVGFTTIAAHCSPVQVVDLLNDLYTIFDATINAYNVYKVETIGDAYMVVSGLPVKIPDHAEQIATMALDLLHESGSFKVKHLPGVPLQLRIGLHTGPCCAGVVGLTMPRYCLFGDTVNTASRMESTGSSSRIHMSEVTRDRLEAAGGYNIEARGPIEIKGKGLMNTFWLLGKKEFDKPLPSPPPVSLDDTIVNKCISFIPQSVIPKSPIPVPTTTITPTVSISSAVLSRINSNNNNSTNPSSSRSSSITGDLVDVKVEITPPINNNIETPLVLPNLYNLDNPAISPNLSILSGNDIQQQSGKISPTCLPTQQSLSSSISSQRKLSELAISPLPTSVAENLLNPTNFNRLPSTSTNSTTSSCSSSRLYKKIEEMIDLSSPYNHYKCLSPSENNLTQFSDGKYIYSKMDSKPGSSRLLRRQFSLDRDDGQQLQQQLQQQHQQQLLLVHQHQSHQHHSQLQLHQSTSSFISGPNPLHTKQSLEIPVLQESRWSPKNQLPRLHKQNSTSIAQDLEKIEEIPMSPSGSSHHHSSLESSLNRSPPTPSASGGNNGKDKDRHKLSIPSSEGEQSICLQEGNNVVGNIGSSRSPGHRNNKELTLTVETLMTR